MRLRGLGRSALQHDDVRKQASLDMLDMAFYDCGWLALAMSEGRTARDEKHSAREHDDPAHLHLTQKRKTPSRLTRTFVLRCIRSRRNIAVRHRSTFDSSTP